MYARMSPVQGSDTSSASPPTPSPREVVLPPIAQLLPHKSPSSPPVRTAAPPPSLARSGGTRGRSYASPSSPTYRLRSASPPCPRPAAGEPMRHFAFPPRPRPAPPPAPGPAAHALATDARPEHALGMLASVSSRAPPRVRGHHRSHSLNQWHPARTWARSAHAHAHAHAPYPPRDVMMVYYPAPSYATYLGAPYGSPPLCQTHSRHRSWDGYDRPEAGAGAGAAPPLLPSKYECNWCGKRFTRPSSLRIHNHVHTGEKPYVCDVYGCHRAFSVPSNLRRHQRSHSKCGPTCQKASPPADAQPPEPAQDTPSQQT